ncbi:hypothetical protein CYMTET_9982 [Cymbomonas tetramitiformis]|uniref:Uncharacterized protein n=1 Tax=Cymbomonas tetramitiformis TaxID=36881 RepID=A0AAE0LEX3_9CHLO|nr:hypothetical protein CYMTET_9982 [Cymbomonas tetramitiformis]
MADKTGNPPATINGTARMRYRTAAYLAKLLGDAGVDRASIEDLVKLIPYMETNCEFFVRWIRIMLLGRSKALLDSQNYQNLVKLVYDGDHDIKI